MTGTTVLIRRAEMLEAADIYPSSNAEEGIRSIENWLKTKGVRDFEAVSLNKEHMSKVCLWWYPSHLI